MANDIYTAAMVAHKLTGEPEIAYITLFGEKHEVPFTVEWQGECVTFKAVSDIVIRCKQDSFIPPFAHVELPPHYSAPPIYVELGGGEMKAYADTDVTITFDQGLMIKKEE